MKIKLIFSLTLLTLVLAACGGQTPQTSPAPASPSQTESQPASIPTLESIATDPVVPATQAPAVGDVSFLNDIQPIFVNSCSDCHGSNQTKAGLDVTTYENLMAGSFNGVVILAGDSSGSFLVQQVVEGEMPKRGPKLTTEQIQLISKWIDAGALNN